MSPQPNRVIFHRRLPALRHGDHCGKKTKKTSNSRSWIPRKKMKNPDPVISSIPLLLLPLLDATNRLKSSSASGEEDFRSDLNWILYHPRMPTMTLKISLPRTTISLQECVLQWLWLWLPVFRQKPVSYYRTSQCSHSSTS
ncbi:hypothetical protein LINGRAHAP2_LOCUS21178 [Linum grandiflorum]